MYIMTANGWKSLGGYADRLEQEATARTAREQQARDAYRAALLAPMDALSEEAHRAKHARCNQLFHALMAV